MRATPIRSMLLVVTMVLVGCQSGTSPPEGNLPEGPHDPAAEMQPDLLQITPSPARVGDLIEVRFPEETLRGIGWVLESQEGDSWQQRYFLVSDELGEPRWWGAEDSEGQGWEDLGVTGPGPDTLLIPDVAAPGNYRLCTANSQPNFCSELEIDD